MRKIADMIGIFCFLFLLCFTSSVFAQDTVGTLRNIEGFVQIDAFGNDRFISAVIGDVLYDSTVLRTDMNSWAVVEIHGDEFKIPPRSISKIASVSGVKRNSGRGFFGKLIEGIAQSLKPPEEDVADFGGRAASIDTDDSFDSMIFDDIDVNEEYATAHEALEIGDFEKVIDHLKLIEYPEDGSFPIEQYYIDLSYSYFSTGDFDSSLLTAFDYLCIEPDQTSLYLLPFQLQLLVGLSAYYSGNNLMAYNALETYVEETGLENANIEAIAIWIRLMRKDDPDDVATWERRIKSAHNSVDWELLLRE